MNPYYSEVRFAFDAHNGPFGLCAANLNKGLPQAARTHEP